MAVIRCVGSRDSGQSRHQYAIWAHAIKRKRPLCLGWDYAIQQNKSNRDALCGLMIESGESLYLVGATKEKDGKALSRYTCVKEENRYALCG